MTTAHGRGSVPVGRHRGPVVDGVRVDTDDLCLTTASALRAVDAVTELWPLIARLEARAAEGHIERETLVLLGQARVALGVSLGTVLPEERLAAAARWTGKALIIAEGLENRFFLAHTPRMHGNELRKANRVPAAIQRLTRGAEASRQDSRGSVRQVGRRMFVTLGSTG